MASLNPFQMFNLAPSFALDEAKLDAAYREVQKKVHPDRFANASDAEKRVAQQWSGFVNEAYATLSDPAKRAKLLAELNGVTFDENQSGGLDEEFLLDQLDRREAIEEGLQQGDSAGIAPLVQSVKDDYAALNSALADAIDGRRDFAAVPDLVRKLLFIRKQMQLLEKA